MSIRCSQLVAINWKMGTICKHLIQWKNYALWCFSTVITKKIKLSKANKKHHVKHFCVRLKWFSWFLYHLIFKVTFEYIPRHFFSTYKCFSHFLPFAINGSQLRTCYQNFFLRNLSLRQDDYIYLVYKNNHHWFFMDIVNLQKNTFLWIFLYTNL